MGRKYWKDLETEYLNSLVPEKTVYIQWSIPLILALTDMCRNENHRRYLTNMCKRYPGAIYGEQLTNFFTYLTMQD